MKTSKISISILALLLLLSGCNMLSAQTNRNLGLTGGPDGDYSGFEKPGFFNLSFNNVPGITPVNTTALPANSLQIVLALPPEIEFDNAYTPPNGWTFTKTGANTVVLKQTGPISSSFPASLVVFAVPLTTKAAVTDGVWSAQIQRLLPTYQDTDPSNSSPSGTVSVADVNLPVTLSVFNATKESTTASLTWDTTEETNSDRFEIQHSLNAKNWAKIGSVASHGESKIKRDYSYTHATPSAGSNYYRLKMVDRDNTFAYSSIRSLDFDRSAVAGGDVSAQVYPNPVSETLTIDAKDWSTVSNVQLVNVSGVSVYNSGKTPSQFVDVKGLQAGMYLVKILKVDGSALVQKIVVGR
jgi:hypothetical protein